METNQSVRKAVEVAMDSRKNLARTFRTPVGICYVMYDDSMIGGFNIERYGYDGLHAEEVGIIRSLDKGYFGADYRKMAEVFQDAGHNEPEYFPACPLHCWGTMYTFTNPNLEIVVAGVNGEEQYRCLLGDIKPPSPALVYPSEKIRNIKPLLNFQPRSLNAQKTEAKTYRWEKDSRNYEGIIGAAVDYSKKNVVFDPSKYGPYLAFDSVAFGMYDGNVFGGFNVHTWSHKGYKPELTGSVLAMAEGYNDRDFDAMVGVVPEFVEPSRIKGFLYGLGECWDTVREFAHPDINIVAVDHNKNILYEGWMLANDAGQMMERLKEIRPRSNSKPKSYSI